MKSLVWAAGISIAGTAVVTAQPAPASPAEAAVATNAVGPRIQFETPVFDFGKIKGGEPAKHIYVFTNTGDRVLIINSVQPQCGCTTAGDWTKEAQPGKTGTIPIQFNTAGYGGGFSKNVTVTCNASNQPTVILQFKGTVYKPYDVNPQLAVLNVSADQEAASAVVTITNNTDEPLNLSEPASNNRMLAAELKATSPGKGYELKISTVPPLSAGNVSAQITLKTGSTNPPTITVPAVVNVRAAVMVVPPHITLAAGPLQIAVTNSVSIQNQSTNALEVSEPEVNAPGVEVQIKEMQPGKSFTALVAFPEGFEVPQGRQVEMSFKTSSPKFPVVKVPILQMPRPATPPVPPPPPVKRVPSAAAKPPPVPLPPPPPLPPLPPAR